MNFSSRLGSVLTMFTYISKLFTSFSVMTPFLITSSGSSSMIVATRFCTATAAMSGSVPTAKVTSIATLPLLLDTDDMCVIPGTPLIAFSNGTADAVQGHVEAVLEPVAAFERTVEVEDVALDEEGDDAGERATATLAYRWDVTADELGIHRSWLPSAHADALGWAIEPGDPTSASGSTHH